MVATPRDPGTHELGLHRQRDSILYIPISAKPDTPAPLVMYLHGATGAAEQGVRKLSGLADQFGFLLLPPASQDGTWDAIGNGYGADVHTIDQALTRAFAARRVDERRIAVCGFSDGASYALGLGLSNGDLFGSVMAFSPGFIPSGSTRVGRPRIFVSHGTNDSILPIETCSRRLVPELTRSGYQVRFREFNGPHAIPPDIAEEAMRWLLG
jgi:predicted esterase